jgi:hypothetical protein
MSDATLKEVLAGLNVSKTEFAKAHKLSRQALESREKTGWLVGYKSGEMIMYNPKHLTNIQVSMLGKKEIEEV